MFDVVGTTQEFKEEPEGINRLGVKSAVLLAYYVKDFTSTRSTQFS